MDKKAITEEIIKELKLDIDLKKAMLTFWYPDRKSTNLRLTKAGMRAMCKLMKPYEFEYETRPTGNNLMRLMNVQAPFYIDFQGTVVIFGDQLASLILLYGSFDKYMQALTDDTWDT